MYLTKNETKLKYKEYLLSEHWQSLRNQALKRDNFKCRRCEVAEELQVHHLFYRKNWYHTKVDDLLTLCKFCHDRHHKIMDSELVEPGPMPPTETEIRVNINDFIYCFDKGWKRKPKIKQNKVPLKTSNHSINVKKIGKDIEEIYILMSQKKRENAKAKILEIFEILKKSPEDHLHKLKKRLIKVAARFNKRYNQRKIGIDINFW